MNDKLIPEEPPYEIPLFSMWYLTYTMFTLQDPYVKEWASAPK